MTKKNKGGGERKKKRESDLCECELCVRVCDVVDAVATFTSCMGLCGYVKKIFSWKSW